MIIEGSQYTDPRSALRSTQVLPAASGLSGGGQTLLDSWNVDNVSAHAERAVYRDASSLRGEYKHCCHVLIHLFIFCLGLSLNTSMRKDVFSSAALLLRNHNISVKELVSKCCERRANYARIYRPFCIFFKVILPFWHYSHCRISINVILNRSITDTG